MFFYDAIEYWNVELDLRLSKEEQSTALATVTGSRFQVRSCSALAHKFGKYL